MKKTCLMLLLPLLLIGNSCDDDTPDCGCGSETVISIEEPEKLTGRLFYKNDTIGNNFNNQKYWIVYVEENCTNCVHHMIVCNEAILSKIQTIPEFSDVGDFINYPTHYENGLEVELSGKLQSVCDRPIALGDYTYNTIFLTSIDKK